MIAFSCPGCEKWCVSPDEIAGHEAECGQCQTRFIVPEMSHDYPEPHRKRWGPLVWTLFCMAVVAVHVGIYWGTLVLFNMSQAGEPFAFAIGMVLMFGGFVGLVGVFSLKRRKRMDQE